MQVATKDGVRLHVQELGAGPPVVMLHGLLLGNMSTWYFHTAPALAQRHRVVLFDLRGHGKSDRARDGYGVARMAGDLQAVLDDRHCERATLVGHSYGAVVALTFALLHPDRVAKLVLVEAPLPPSRLAELEAFVSAPPDEMWSALPASLASTLGGRRGKRFVDSMRFFAEETTLFEDLRRAEDVPDEALQSLHCPLLAVYGTGSSCRPVGERLGRSVPGAHIAELPGGHFLPLESSAPLTELVTRFIDA